MKKIVFRVDSGSHLGIGHLMRCLVLAEEFSKFHPEIFFITKKHFGSRPELIPSQYKTFFIDGTVDTILPKKFKDSYEHWLGGSVESDLKQTQNILSQIGSIDLFVVDNYSLGSDYEKSIRADKIFVIDDLMNRHHYCDYFLDQNLQATADIYSGFMDKMDTVMFLGPGFALLRPEFLTLRTRLELTPRKIEKIKKILVSFGGEDVNSDTLKMANSLSKETVEKYHFTFILKSTHSTYPLFLEWAKQYPSNVTVFNFSNMAELIMDNDLFVGAGGSTSWERLALGIPSVIICVAENQRNICEALAIKDYVCYLGASNEVSPARWQSFFEKELENTASLKKMAERGLQLVDCRGTQKIVDRIEAEAFA